MKRLLVFSLSLFITITVFGQSAEEAVRYSQLKFSGTARGMGVAGAFGAVGADFTSIIINPAGLGVYRKSELMVTPRLEKFKTRSDYLGERTYDDRFNFNIGNIGFVYSKMFEDQTGLRSKGKLVAINFGIGYNRLANFYEDRYFRATETGNSVLATYANDLDGIPEADISYSSESFEAVSAYSTYLISPLSSDPTTYGFVTDTGLVNQSITHESRGAIDELSFSVAANYNNKLYFGGYIGVPFLRYHQTVTHSEDDAGTIDQFNYFDLTQSLNSSGVGVNFKLGLIYRINNWVRLGASLHTPTFYGVDDDFSTYMYTDFDTVAYEATSPTGDFSYNMVTPMRVTGSLALLLKKYGFISFDYEWVNYGLAKYKMDNTYKDFELDVNNDIRMLYGSAHIFRVGAEFVINKLRLRSGFAHYGSPGDNYDSSMSFTGGFGFRLKRFFMDFAYIRTRTDNVSLMVNDVQGVTNKKSDTYMITMGFRFGGAK